MDVLTQSNQARWNELAPVHAQSAFYDLVGFRAGKCSLRSIEVEQLGCVDGQSLLHLQCHIGTDTLSWARRGAQVTGVDFSAPAIAQAHGLAQELDLAAQFICCDVYDLAEHLDGAFDIVFASYGVLHWLRDLDRWMQIVRHFLKPGGRFLLIDDHPIARLRYVGSGRRFHFERTYAEPHYQVSHTTTYLWYYTLADIINSTLRAGLALTRYNEYPFSFHALHPNLQPHEDGWWYPPTPQGPVPLLFSLMAISSGTAPTGEAVPRRQGP